MKISLYIVALTCLLWPSQSKKASKTHKDDPVVTPVPPVQDNKPVKDGEDADKGFTLPENLSDANQDGKVDEADFIRGFANLEMTTWEIKQIFSMADFTKQGNLDISQWRLFSEMFIQKFNKADADHNLLLSADELKESMTDITPVASIFEDDETSA